MILAKSASRNKLRASFAYPLFGVVLIITGSTITRIKLAGITMILFCSAGTAFSSKDIILIRSASLADSFNIAGAAVSYIVTYNAFFQDFVEIIILWAKIASTRVFAL